MTYCVAMLLDAGMIFASDSRTNAGVDHIARFSKMRVFARDADYRSRVARSGEHPAQEKEVARLYGRHVRAKRRWRIRQMNAELGETILGGR